MEAENSVEYRTIIHHFSDIQLAVKDNLDRLGTVFVSKYLIKPDQSGELRNEYLSKEKRAADLVDLIRKKVLENIDNYQLFVDALNSETFYGDILGKLQRTYSHYQQQSQGTLHIFNIMKQFVCYLC